MHHGDTEGTEEEREEGMAKRNVAGQVGRRERPILFNGEMVRAILEGRKTQTRRMVKPQNCNRIFWNPIVLNGYGGWTDDHGNPVPCPYGKPGDRVWVRETWQVVQSWQEYGAWFRDETDGDTEELEDEVARGASDLVFQATDPSILVLDHPLVATHPIRWRPSIHMPRWASRITLEVTDVRVERVQEMKRSDAFLEGCPLHIAGHDGNIEAAHNWFRTLWDSINAKRGYGWDANPWVCVVEFMHHGGTEGTEEEGEGRKA